MDKKVIPAHSDVKRLVEVAHYEAHDKRTESAEFRQSKKYLHQHNVPCFINNGRCEGHLEVHHNIIEYSASTEVDWDKVKKDFPNVTSVDDLDQMMVLCEKHHRQPGFGIHDMEYPIWILQKYMTEEALDKFEADVKKYLGDE
jgi:hypothetical protein